MKNVLQNDRVRFGRCKSQTLTINRYLVPFSDLIVWY